MRRRIGPLYVVVATNLCACHLWSLPTDAASVPGTRQTQPWIPHDYPSPDQDSCHGGASKRLCDPDSILSAKDVERLKEALIDSPSRKVALERKCFPSSSSSSSSSAQANAVAVQYGVAILRKARCFKSMMNLLADSLSEHIDNPDVAAEIFARQIHDTWGVGLETYACGGTGLLLFLSTDDRAVFISRGRAMEAVLTNRRLDKTVEGMKPYLLERDFGHALMFAMREIDAYLLAGVPNWRESSVDFAFEHVGYFFLVGFIGLFALAASHEQKQRREYAAVASHLSELDRARAEALQGRFEAKSCPICLEKFIVNAPPNHDGSSPDNETEALLCTGSDGLPLKLLRCGHVFDEKCWADWINSGHHGKIDKCPICQQDVGRPTVAPDRMSESTTSINHGASSTTPGNVSSRSQDGWVQHGNLDEEFRNRALRQYVYDRNFRLLRLASRYPRYIQPQQIQSWTQVGYDGTLARDPSFVNNDPARQTASSNANGSSGFRRSGASGFGGGYSGGGRGGRW